MSEQEFKLTAADQADFLAYSHIVEKEYRCLHSVWKRERRAYGRDDVISAGYVALAEALILWPQIRERYPQYNKDSFLGFRIKRRMLEFSAHNDSAVTRTKHVWAAIGKGKRQAGDTVRRRMTGGKAVSSVFEWHMARSTSGGPDDKPVDRGGVHSPEWMDLRERGIRAVAVSVDRFTGLERIVAEAVCRERLCISNPAYRTPRPVIGRRFGLDGWQVYRLETRILKTAGVVLRGGRLYPLHQTNLGTARRVMKHAGQAAQNVIAAIVGLVCGPEAVAAAAIAAARVLAPSDARASVQDLADWLGIGTDAVKRIERDLLGQAVRLLGVAA